MKEIGMDGIRGPYGELKCVLVTLGVRPGWEKRIMIKYIRFYTLKAIQADYTFGGRHG